MPIASLSCGATSARYSSSSGSCRLVGVRGRGQAQLAATLGDVHGAPLAEARHDQLRYQGEGQLDVERLGEQLARLGQERQPGPPLGVGPAQPVDSRAAARAVRRSSDGQRLGYASGPAPVTTSSPHHGLVQPQRQPETGVAGPGHPADRGDRSRPVALVDHDRDAGRPDHLAQPAQHLLGDLAEPGVSRSPPPAAPSAVSASGGGACNGLRRRIASGAAEPAESAEPASSSRNQTPLPSGKCSVPQDLASASTRCSPRPRSARSPVSGPPEGVLNSGPDLKSRTLTVIEPEPAMISNSTSVQA